VNIDRFSDARAFLDRAEDWLLLREAEYNVVLGITDRLLRGDHPWTSPIYLATVETNGRVSGCAWRTPPHKLGLTRLPMESIPLLANDVAEVYSDIPGVLAPVAEGTEFAKCWSRSRDADWSLGIRQRIFSLEQVKSTSIPVGGTLQRAEAADLPLVAEWGAGFSRDTGIEDFDPLPYSEHLIRNGAVYLWQDHEFRSMAAAVGTTPNGTRVGYVYTPPSFRGRGYATATVTSLSRLLLDGRRRFCFLYADLANPTSNAIYQRIGYQPIAEVADIWFR
jgi:GNAT superfamily N-acetyltransferase